jgi:hypothetical protein
MHGHMNVKFAFITIIIIDLITLISHAEMAEWTIYLFDWFWLACFTALCFTLSSLYCETCMLGCVLLVLHSS